MESFNLGNVKEFEWTSVNLLSEGKIICIAQADPLNPTNRKISHVYLTREEFDEMVIKVQETKVEKIKVSEHA